MTIDERIEALTKRHEDAMLETELLRGMMKDGLARMDRTDQQIAALTALVLSHENRIQGMEGSNG